MAFLWRCVRFHPKHLGKAPFVRGNGFFLPFERGGNTLPELVSSFRGQFDLPVKEAVVLLDQVVTEIVLFREDLCPRERFSDSGWSQNGPGRSSVFCY